MSNLNTCGCCAAMPALETITNRPGLGSLEYRIGVYGSFLMRLLDGIHSVQIPTGPNQGTQPLTALTTRSSDDPSIALLDAWAVLADVLTFYQERIANEGYLRTATERRSILELAREIGYELAPGVAAKILLQFTVDNIIGAPVPGTQGLANTPFNSGRVLIPQGTQVQSIPVANQTPQLFETSADFEARVDRNQILPRQERAPDLALSNGKLYLLGASSSFRKGTYTNLPATQLYLLNPSTTLDPSLSQIPAVEMNQIYLQGTSTNLKYGDRLLLVGVRNTTTKTQSFVVLDVETDSANSRTAVIIGDGSPVIPSFQSFKFQAAAAGAQNLAFNQTNVANQIRDTSISESALDAFLEANDWDPDQLSALVNNPPAQATSPNGAFAMRATCGFFGHNAPAWKSLPNPSTAQRADQYPSDWDSPNHGDGRLIWTDSQGVQYPDADAFLERTFPQILANSWVVFESPKAGTASYQVTTVMEKALADYGYSGRSTGLKLQLSSQVKGISLGSPSVVAAFANQIDVFAIGFDGHLYHRWLDSSNKWQGPESLSGDGLAHAPSAVSWGPNRIDVFAIASDGNLYHWWTNGNNQWSGPENRGGGNLVNSPSAISRAANSLDVAAVGSDGNLYVFTWDGQNWSGPNNWGGGNLTNSPSAVPVGTDDVAVFIVGTDGVLYQAASINLFNQHSIVSPQPLQGVGQGLFVDSPSAIWLPVPGAFYVAARITQGPIWVISMETIFGQFFNQWMPVVILDGQFSGSPLATVLNAATLELLAIGSDGNVHAVPWSFNFGAFEEATTQNLGGDGNLLNSPAAVVLPSGQIDIVAVGGSGHWFYTSGDGATWQPIQDLGNGTMVPFLVRETTAYVQSEQLVLAGVPVVDDIPAGSESIMLDSLVLGLDIGQPVSLVGMRADAPAVAATELLTVGGIVHNGGFTTLTFQPKLQNRYQRSTVTISANVTAATNGATVTEVLGNGDGSQANQSFTLKRPPMTFVSAPTPTGIASTLQVNVNNVPWTQVSTLYGLDSSDQDYIVRMADDGTPTITFGEPAARLKSGKQNVRATYRTGIGLAGNVNAGSVSILMSRPPGLRGVTNPLAATGGADPQPLSQARENAPLTVLTLDRIVSLADYENFAKAFAGVGKAQAIQLWSGETRLAHLTIADSSGNPIVKGSTFYNTLVGAITSFHDPVQSFMLAGFQPLSFNLTVAILVDTPTYTQDTVYAAIVDALTGAFAFEQRAFAQAVTEAEIVQLIQSVPGVVACNLSQLYLASDPTGPSQTEPPPFIPASPARWYHGVIQPAQLLLLNRSGVTLKEMAP